MIRASNYDKESNTEFRLSRKEECIKKDRLFFIYKFFNRIDDWLESF